MTTYPELAAACDRIGLSIALELRGAGKTVPQPEKTRPYRRVLKVLTRRHGAKRVLASVSAEAEEHLDCMAYRLAEQLAGAGVPLRSA